MFKIRTTSLLTILLFFAISGLCFSDTLYLKDGRSIESENIWEKDGYYMYVMYGATVGISKDKVERVETTKKENESTFRFDIWPFGITVNNAINLAESHDVPLHKSGIISINKRFHSQVRKYSNAKHFYYNTNLLGHFAKVNLYFTPVSKKLHTVKIQWPNQKTNDPKLMNEITAMISGKYGKPQKQGRKLFYSTKNWLTEDGNKLEMRVSLTAIFLSYLHTDLRQLDYNESEGLKIQKIQSGVKKDKDKF